MRIPLTVVLLLAISSSGHADPRRRITVQVPTRLAIVRTDDTLSVHLDEKAREGAVITVDADLVTGIKSSLAVHLAGEAARPGRLGLTSGLDFTIGEDLYHRKPDGLPIPGKHYVVEMTLELFETDVRPQHMWSPESKRYKVLWSRTLTQAVD